MTKRFELDPRLKTIAEYYRFDLQADKAIEEMAELIVEIKHLQTPHGRDYKPFIEELADVKIMIDQLIFLVRQDPHLEKLFDTATEFKIERQLKRIAADEEDQE